MGLRDLQACGAAGGFMTFEDIFRPHSRQVTLSCSDMRMAVTRGRAGI